jgi:integrase
MAERRQLPPQIRRVELDRRAGSKTLVRYQLTVDTGTAEGKRKQLRRRYRTEKEAWAALAEIQGQVNAGTYVQPSTLTVEQGFPNLRRRRGPWSRCCSDPPSSKVGRKRAVSRWFGRETSEPAAR